MKSWKDRGEVLDSDDEELSIEAESQSPGPDRKRFKPDDGVDRSDVDSKSLSTVRKGAQRLEDEDWSYPKVIITYGKNSHIRANTNTVRREQAVDAGIREPEPPTPSHHNCLDEGANNLIGHASSQSDKSEGLPELSELLVWKATTQQSPRALERQAQSHASSSPLSEREISPPAPPGVFRFPRLGVNAPATPSNPSSHNDGTEEWHNESVLIEEVEPGPDKRRNLRARKQKQLHPYLFDQEQYRQQCRERGMRPVRITEAEQTNTETQDASLNQDEGDSFPVSQEFSSPLSKPSPGPTERSPRNYVPRSDHTSTANTTNDSDELPDLPLFQRPVSGGNFHDAKRRELFHTAQMPPLRSAGTQNSANSRHNNELSIPPSPPPTSSDSRTRSRPNTGPAVFRLPRGLSPAPLPTPQISSDIRHGINDTASDMSGTESLPRTSRPSSSSRMRRQTATFDSSSGASEAESEPEVDKRHLRQEQKRIKGVLPASWLKIDFRAQQRQASPSPSGRRRDSSTSPQRTLPQKGIARKITTRRSTSPKQGIAIVISDDEVESDNSKRRSSPPTARQTKLRFDRDTTATAEFMNDDMMEVDWVDPMLSGPSRSRAKLSKQKKRQPRIMDVFAAAADRIPDFSEERRVVQQAAGTSSRKRPRTRRTRMKAQQSPLAPRLSIIDTPQACAGSINDIPQFVRLAMRKARAQPDQARHLPTGKYLRLTTNDDTEDATSMLRAWQEGSLAPRHVESVHARPHGRQPTVGDDVDSRRRSPLRSIQHNIQRKLPPSHPRESDSSVPKCRSTPVIRRPKATQTRLHVLTTTPADTDIDGEQNKATAAPERAEDPPQIQNSIARRIRGPEYRGAQLESLEDNFDRRHRAAAFERRMHCLTENVVRPSRNVGRSFQLARFLRDPDAVGGAVAASTTYRQTTESKPPVLESAKHTTVLARRPRKLQSRRLDTEAREYRQPSEPLPDVIDLSEQDNSNAAETIQVLYGLGPFGTRYATDFDILPLSLGTYFHESSFIGSGDFAASLNFAGRDLDVPTGRIRVHIDGDVLELGAWTEEVSAGLARIPKAVSRALGSLNAEHESQQMHDTVALILSNVDYLLRSTVRYFSRCLAFLDPVDRRQCVSSLQLLIDELLETVMEQELARSSASDVITRCMQYTLVLSGQCKSLSNHDLVEQTCRTRSEVLLQRSASHLTGNIFPRAFHELKCFYEDNRKMSKREIGVRDTDTAFNSIVLLRHVLSNFNDKVTAFWNIVQQAMNTDVTKVHTVTGIDNIWYNIFCLLPSVEVDVTGILRPGSRLQDSHESWTLVKSLVSRVFESASACQSVPSSTINEYVRATLTRCHVLITRWGWWRCESILGTMFDFFARRGLAQLPNEEDRGSPRFLAHLEQEPSLEVQVDDRSFHIFLKMLAVSLQGMYKRGIYSDRKIGGIAWRFIPNHGRTYRKDEDVRQENIDTLRNHHDLLCTLYYASPPEHRLRAELIRNLVDHSISHREACRLNVRAWASLATFQVSTNERLERLEPFNEWFKDILITTIGQYRLAKSEVEQDVAKAKAQGKPEVSSTIVQDTIARNQRQIATTLVDSLAALKHSLRCCKTVATVRYIVRECSFWQVFDLFDPSSRCLHGLLEEALDVANTALDVEQQLHSNVTTQQASDDSQDYGDFVALEELASTSPNAQSLDITVVEVLHGPIASVISNIFGADAVTDDTLLTKVVHLWTRIGKGTVQQGSRSWASYISGYSSDAWSQLRGTTQRRKYTPYFLSRIVELSDVALEDTDVFMLWLACLVDREATLKYQHLLTSALLNYHLDEPLLYNLPFSRHGEKYEISIHELRQRRVALLSAVMSNMRNNVDIPMNTQSRNIQALRIRYANLLRHLMQTMKGNYQDIQSSGHGDVADVNIQGAYVEFVHQIISHLQQYTAEICPIDRFFTDSTAFPLPATDPTYVVGRLRSYESRLSENRKRKELASFVLNVSERAVVDGEQTYLVDQLVTAMTGSLERGNRSAPSLRHVLCTSVVPAYIENALSTACSWIAALPILEACGRVVNSLLYEVKLEDVDSIQAAHEITASLLQSMATAVKGVLAHPGLVALPHVQVILSTIFQTARQCLTPSEYLRSNRLDTNTLPARLSQLVFYAEHIDAQMSDSAVQLGTNILHTEIEARCAWPDTRDFTQKQVQEKFGTDWYARDGQYFVKRGINAVEVVVPLPDEEEGKVHLQVALDEFCRSYNAVFQARPMVQDTTHGSLSTDALIV